MEKRTLIALALSFLVLGFYPVILQKFYPDYYKENKAVTLKAKQAAAAKKNGTLPVSAFGAVAPEKDIFFKNDKLKISFNEKGGAIREAEFSQYRGEKEAALHLFSLTDISAAPTLVQLVGATSVPTYTVERSGKSIQAHGQLSDKLSVAKEITFAPSGYSADLKLHFENKSSEPVEMQYQIFSGKNFPLRNSIDMQYDEANFYSEVNGKKLLKHVKESKLGKSVQSQGNLEWIATKDRHFSIIIKPKNAKNFTGLVEGLGNHQFQASLLSEKILVDRKSTRLNSSHGTLSRMPSSA